MTTTITATAVRYPDGTIGLFVDRERAVQAAAKAHGTVHELVERQAPPTPPTRPTVPGPRPDMLPDDDIEPWHMPHTRGMANDSNDSEGGTHD